MSFRATSFLVFVIACAIGLSSAAVAADDAAAAREVYLVRLARAPLIEHVRERLAAGGAGAMNPRQALRRELVSGDSQDYLAMLDADRRQVLDAAAATFGRALVPHHVFRHTVNGMALTLSADEATRLAALPGVARVRRARVEHVLTDAGPQWIGADALWNGGVAGVAATKGEGVVIGVIDTGINPTHPSFAATGGDGYTHTNPRGHFYGLCASGQATCNAKLIGIYDMTSEGTQGIDSVGHGSHVSGIAAGNAINDALQGHTVALPRNVSGVAPHANLIMYKACTNDTSGTSGGNCSEADLVAAIDQAAADQVDVINYSIGGDAADAYALLDDGGSDAAAMFQARAAGVVVVAAAGNEGPGPHSLDEPGNAPWVIGVANASHNRRFVNSVGAFNGAPNPPPTLTGQGYTTGYGPAAIVYAGDYGNALCGVGQSQGTAPTGASNPFAPNTFHGEIVICDRGTYARVEKGYNVRAAGAGGYILANTAADGESTVSDDHYLPAVHLGYAEGQALKQWLAAPGAHNGTIAGVSAALDAKFGDILSASSSRGPYGFGGGILKPDLTAPGTNILSAAKSGSGLALLTGTSMASPHVAGAAALVIAAHPSWSPDQVESALLGTALGGSVRKEDATTPATPLDAGAGRVQPAAAARAGLYLPLGNADIRAQDPARGGDPSRLNRVGIESEHCLATCSFTRTVADLSGGGIWQASTSASAGAVVTVTPTQFSLAPGASQTLTIGVDVSDPHLAGSWVYGSIVLHKSTGGQGASDTVLPLAVYAAPGAAPAFRELAASGPGGSATLDVGGLIALPQPKFTATALVPATLTPLSLGVDPKPNQLYDSFPGTGKQFVLFDNPTAQGADFATQAYSFIVEVSSSTAPFTDLYAGIDSNGDGQPEFAEQACHASTTSASGTTARCVIDLAGAGTARVWALVDIPQGVAGSNYAVTLSSGIPAITRVLPGSDTPGFGVIGPGHAAAMQSFPLRLFWGTANGLPALAPNTRYYGNVLIDAVADSANLGQVAKLPFALTRNAGGDDVLDALAPTASRVLALEPGESLAHQFVDVAGNGKLTVTTALVGSTGSVAFYAVRADFPAPSAAPQVAAAPPADGGSPQWTLDASGPRRSVTLPVSAGRWYLVASNGGASEAQFTEALDFAPSDAVAPPAPGAYYNPQRSGHGVFLSQANGQQAVYWYTYLEDGTPVWYGAQGPAPTAGAWTAPLFRVSWNGSAINTYGVVGDVVVTPIDANDFLFSWHLAGSGGSERFVLLAPNACVSLGGGAADVTGQWYAPAQSGSGMDVVAEPARGSGDSLQFDAFYFYDSLGQPRWAAGSVSPVAAASTLTMNQLQGFCPSCAYAPTTPTPIGTLTVDFASPVSGSYRTNLTLAAPLSGSWVIDQPITRLTGTPSCP